jgi:hypothetical protein
MATEQTSEKVGEKTVQPTMNETANLNMTETEDSAEFLEFQEKVKDANLNDKTLLATDYLNHFNEIIMMLEMVPDMPELLVEAKAWAPKSYPDHFRDSKFSDKDLAIEAYEHSPARYKTPFETTVSTINNLISVTIERAEEVMETGNADHLRLMVSDSSQTIQTLMDRAGASINGSLITMDQTEIDDLSDP